MRVESKLETLLVLLLLQRFYTNIYQYMVSRGKRMAKNTSMTLGNHFDGFISNQLDSGRYGSASEVVRAGLRLLEDSESKLQTLRQLLTEGEESGQVDYSYDSLIAELDSEEQ
jgi:antitoxin ParD1/3/4